MKVVVKNFKNGEKPQTKQSITIPLFALTVINEKVVQFIDENDCDDMEIFIRIGQSNVDKSQFELEVWAEWWKEV